MLKNKKFAIFISIVAVIVVFWSIFSNSRKGAAIPAQNNQPLIQPPDTAGGVPAGSAAAEDDLDKMEIDLGSETLLKRTYQVEPLVRVLPSLSGEIGFQVFTAAAVAATPEQQEPRETVQVPETRLEGIVFSNYGVFAIINGKVYQRGDQVGGRLLAEIGRDYIVLRENEKEEMLFLREPLPLKREQGGAGA